jgi:hypothetical protein
MVGFATQEDIRKNRIMTEFDKHRYSLAYIFSAPRCAYLLVAESATGEVLTQHTPYRVLSLRW